MKKLAGILILIVLSFQLISCKGDKNDEETNPDIIHFNGISQTDDIGAPISAGDSTDWLFSDNWTNKEKGLFTESYANSCIQVDSAYFIAGYPNPCIRYFFLYLQRPDNYRLSFRIVDRNYTILMKIDSVISHSFVIDMGTLNFANDTVRMYYKLFGQDCELTGHGDIKIK